MSDYQPAELLDRILQWRSQFLERSDRPLSDRFLVAARLHQVDRGAREPLRHTDSAAPQLEHAPQLAYPAVVVLSTVTLDMH